MGNSVAVAAGPDGAPGHLAGSQAVVGDNGTRNDPLIFPGMYSPSGVDVMSILVRSVHHSQHQTIPPLGALTHCRQSSDE